MEKVLNWVKSNLRLIEKISIMAGAFLILLISLIFNIFSDTIVNISVGYLIYGLLTGIAGGTLLLVGLNINLFDVKIKGLILVGVGLVLSIASVLLYPGFINSELFTSLSETIKEYKNSAGEITSTLTKANVKTIFNLFTAFSIVSSVSTAVGFGSQLFRKIKNIDD